MSGIDVVVGPMISVGVVVPQLLHKTMENNQRRDARLAVQDPPLRFACVHQTQAAAVLSLPDLAVAVDDGRAKSLAELQHARRNFRRG